jgi:hypothetical protein
MKTFHMVIVRVVWPTLSFALYLCLLSDFPKRYIVENILPVVVCFPFYLVPWVLLSKIEKGFKISTMRHLYMAGGCIILVILCGGAVRMSSQIDIHYGMALIPFGLCFPVIVLSGPFVIADFVWHKLVTKRAKRTSDHER